MKLEDINISNVKINSGNLLLRPFEETDLDDFYEYATVEGVGEAAGWKHHESKEESKLVLDRFIAGHRTFAIVENESGKVIGSISFEPCSAAFDDADLGENKFEIGYVISKDFWNKGYATQALRGMVSYAFYVLHLDALTCGHFAGNEASKRVIEKVGFKYLKDDKFVDQMGTERDCSFYAMTHEDFGVIYK